jgi:hypothetical protein
MKNKLTKEAQRVKQGVLFRILFFSYSSVPLIFVIIILVQKLIFFNISTPQFEKVERNSLENDE